MLSVKRLLYIVVAVAILGGITLAYMIFDAQTDSVQNATQERSTAAFTEERNVEIGEKPRVWIVGNAEDKRDGMIYSNVSQLCDDLHLTTIKTDQIDLAETQSSDVIIFCTSAVSTCVDIDELETFIAEGGHVILAAGLPQDATETLPFSVLGIEQAGLMDTPHKLVFEKPFLPLQPEEAYCAFASESAYVRVSSDVTVYLREAQNNVPLLFTHDWHEGNICLINGTFLEDSTYAGLITGSLCALLPDFIYPVLGTKTVFLDTFSTVSSDDDSGRQAYGYSPEGFMQDVVWPALQGMSLRTETPYTASVAITSLEDTSKTVDTNLLATLGKSVLQLNGELASAASQSGDGESALDTNALDTFGVVFPNYTVRSLVFEPTNAPSSLASSLPETITAVRGTLQQSSLRLSWEDGRLVFPAATWGNSMEDGNLFALYSILGAYGMVSHVFDTHALASWENNTALWDSDKKQLGLFESDILDRTRWLTGTTLAQTADIVRSYQDMDYNWTIEGEHVQLMCSNIREGQAFLYHTTASVEEAQGLSYEDLGNGYYLLHVYNNNTQMTLKERG